MTKWHTYEAKFKLKVTSHAVEHGTRAAAREFNMNESVVRKWRKQEADLGQVKKSKQFPRKQSQIVTNFNSGLLHREQQAEASLQSLFQ